MQNLLSILKTRIFFFIIGLHLRIIVYTTSNISCTESKYVWGGPSRSNDFARLPPGFREKKVLKQTKKTKMQTEESHYLPKTEAKTSFEFGEILKMTTNTCNLMFQCLLKSYISLYRKDIHNEKKLHIWKIFLLLPLSIPFFTINAATK